MVQIGFKTDPGKTRSVNEDALFVMPKQNIYIIADGVGGHNAGELASRTAVGCIAEYIGHNPIPNALSEEAIKKYFQTCMDMANTSVVELSKVGREFKGMATTAVILYIKSKKAYIINVGDSRAYLIRKETIKQITEDHTLVSQLLKEGTITKEEAWVHPMNNMITRALGGETQVDADFFHIDIVKDDILMLCTDGLHNEIPEQQMVAILKNSINMHEACSNLVRSANDHAGKDNITAICVRI
jgi:protein phosphatase